MIEYAKVKNAPIYARESIRDDEVSIHSSEVNYVISLDSDWRADGQESYQQKGILYYADKNNEKWIPITGGGTKFYKHAFALELGKDGTVQETWNFEIVNADATPVEDESSFVNILGKPMFYNDITVAPSEQEDDVTCYIMGVFKTNGTPSIMRIDMGDISSTRLSEFLPTVITYGTDTVTEL